MTKPVETPAVVSVVTGNPFDVQTKLNAVMLLSNNTVQLKGNFMLENFVLDVKERTALEEAYEASNMVTLEAAVGADGRPMTDKQAPILLHEFKNLPWDPRKLGRMVIMNRDKLIVIGTHYHPSRSVSFSYQSFKKALVEYCQLAVLQNRRQDPVVIPMPGMECVGVLRAEGAVYVLNEDHVSTIKNIIANTMFPDANVTLVIPD